MAHSSNPPGNKSHLPATSDEQAYIAYGEQLRQAVSVALRPWLVVQLRERFSIEADQVDDVLDAIVADADDRLHELVHADVDVPLSGPLERIRGAVEKLNPRLTALGVTPPARDPFDVRIRPNDVFALGPASFSDLGDDVHQAGITWGAAKAYLHQSRRK